MTALLHGRAALTGAAAVCLVALLPTTAWAAPGGSTGPSSSDEPYLERAIPGVTLTSLLSVGDAVPETHPETPGEQYRMSGIPDGLGAFDNGDGTFTLLANHELPATAGVVREHGGTGAFVSSWIVDSTSLEVLSGDDLIQTVYLWNGTEYVADADYAFNRLCSADLPAASALYDAESGLGYAGRIFFSGEETTGGRAFAHVVETGESFDLPALGGAAWENVVVNPGTGVRTVVAATDDTSGGAVYIYAGDKQATGNPVEQAGLAGGERFAIQLDGLAVEDATSSIDGASYSFEVTADPASATRFARPEDGAWDPAHPGDFYFVTTASMTQHSRLWRLTFTDPGQPELGGTATVVLEGPADPATGPKMMDNITINDRGQLLIQEDPGNQPYLAGVWRYDIAADRVERVAIHDADRFTTSGALFQTQDEESSGIIPAPFLGAGAYLVDVQNHSALADPELVQRGQLLVLRVPPGKPVR